MGSDERSGAPSARPAGARALEAQRLIDIVALRLGPALVAGLVTYSHMHRLGDAVLVFLGILVAVYAIELSPFPLHLMPAARVALAAIAPVAGGGLALGVFLAAGRPERVAEILPAVYGAWFVMSLGAWVKAR